MVAATSSTISTTAASTTDDDDPREHHVMRDIVESVESEDDDSGGGACAIGVASASKVLGIATSSGSSSTMASCAGLMPERHRRPSYTCTPFPHRRHYAVRRKNGVILPR
ncbi:hypothetical protein L9F63_027361 [Diploptera punctata]|uniref:Uncharacterized protein n=1 Tax=Diploptera punctata TaxID=6984 RepID=A0AAD7ZZB7_DIPPU|nr:hypothetical protein L9F63_017757 [Diploptera punctata]KAJ9594656.1 hypothetical protein L9F63_027361 [Diploptera punctata]